MQFIKGEKEGNAHSGLSFWYILTPAHRRRERARRLGVRLKAVGPGLGEMDVGQWGIFHNENIRVYLIV